MKRAKTRADIAAHPFVESIHSEDDGYREDGRPAWWCYLKPGFITDDMECGTIHEGTIREVIDVLDGARPMTDAEAADGYKGTATADELAEARRLFNEIKKGA